MTQSIMAIPIHPRAIPDRNRLLDRIGARAAEVRAGAG
jgi:hypothetical protein